MFSAAKIVSFAVATLGLVGCAVAAPVHNATSLVARGPYDTHNGWVRPAILQLHTATHILKIRPLGVRIQSFPSGLRADR